MSEIGGDGMKGRSDGAIETQAQVQARDGGSPRKVNVRDDDMKVVNNEDGRRPRELAELSGGSSKEIDSRGVVTASGAPAPRPEGRREVSDVGTRGRKRRGRNRSSRRTAGKSRMNEAVTIDLAPLLEDNVSKLSFAAPARPTATDHAKADPIRTQRVNRAVAETVSERGKERETPKAKKPSKLLRIILSEREEALSKSLPESATHDTSTDREVIGGEEEKRRVEEKTRSALVDKEAPVFAGRQYLSPTIDESISSLMTTLRQFQQNYIRQQKEKQGKNFHIERRKLRYVMGLRAVLQLAELGPFDGRVTAEAYPADDAEWRKSRNVSFLSQDRNEFYKLARASTASTTTTTGDAADGLRLTSGVLSPFALPFTPSTSKSNDDSEKTPSSIHKDEREAPPRGRLPRIPTSRLKCVVLAPNIERVEAPDGLKQLEGKILWFCEKAKIPVIYGLTKRKLGALAHPRSCSSALGILSVDGAEEAFRTLLFEAENAREAFERVDTLFRSREDAIDKEKDRMMARQEQK